MQKLYYHEIERKCQGYGIAKESAGMGRTGSGTLYGTVISNHFIWQNIALVYKSIDERSVFGYHDS